MYQGEAICVYKFDAKMFHVCITKTKSTQNGSIKLVYPQVSNVFMLPSQAADFDFFNLALLHQIRTLLYLKFIIVFYKYVPHEILILMLI